MQLTNADIVLIGIICSLVTTVWTLLMVSINMRLKAITDIVKNQDHRIAWNRTQISGLREFATGIKNMHNNIHPDKKVNGLPSLGNGNG